MRRRLVRDTAQHSLGRGPSSETWFLPFKTQTFIQQLRIEGLLCAGRATRLSWGRNQPRGQPPVASSHTHRLQNGALGCPRFHCVTSGMVLPLSGLPLLPFPGLPPPLTWILSSSAPRGSCFQQLRLPPSSSWLLASYPDQPDRPEAPGCSALACYVQAALTSCAREPQSTAGGGHMALPPGQALASPGSLVTFAEGPCWVLWQTGSKPRTTVWVLGKRVVGSPSQPSVSLISGRDVAMNIHRLMNIHTGDAALPNTPRPWAPPQLSGLLHPLFPSTSACGRPYLHCREAWTPGPGLPGGKEP